MCQAPKRIEEELSRDKERTKAEKASHPEISRLSPYFSGFGPQSEHGKIVNFPSRTAIVFAKLGLQLPPYSRSKAKPSPNLQYGKAVMRFADPAGVGAVGEHVGIG